MGPAEGRGAPSADAADEGAAGVHPSLRYRPDIDGLRAVAVLLVVAFHALPDVFPGGFVGVDVFFVISGYLISSVILGQVARGEFRIGEFYSRRVRRIFPALIVVLAGSLSFGWFALLADEYQQLGKHVGGGAGFVSNLVLWQESGYFDNAALTKPLLHLWSLGVEEQFYLLWPLALWAASRRGRSVMPLVLACAVGSFLLNAFTAARSAEAAFYSPLTRFWELMIGGALAWGDLHRKRRWPSGADWVLHACGLAGLCLIVVATNVMTRETLGAGWWALLPTVGAALVIFAGPGAVLNRTLLARRAMVAVGLVSYPVYLWHWPLLSFARILHGGRMDMQGQLLVAAMSLPLAWGTYVLVEKPARHSRAPGRTTVALAVAMALVGLAGVACFAEGGFPARVQGFQQVSQAALEWDFPGRLVPFEFNGRKVLAEQSGRRETTLFIGDSTLAQYYSRADELVQRQPAQTNSLIFAIANGCPPIPHVLRTGMPGCDGLPEDALALALAREDISTVVIGGLWHRYLFNSNAYRDGAEVLPIEIGTPGYRKALSALAEYAQTLKGHGKRVYLVLSGPTGDELSPRHLVRRSLRDFPHVLSMRIGGIPRQQLDERYGQIDRDLKELARANDLRLIEPMEHLCSQGTCASVDADGVPMYRDEMHLRAGYARSAATYMDVTVAPWR